MVDGYGPKDDPETREIERIHLESDATHLIFPGAKLGLADGWASDVAMADTSSDWWNRYRVYRFGPLRFTVEMDVSPDYRLPREDLVQIATRIADNADLPIPAVCGSHSPLSPRYPTSISDIDLVVFIGFDDFFGDIDGWCEREAATKKIVDGIAGTVRRELSCGFLLEDFRAFPFMHEAVDLTPESAHYWDLTTSEVIDTMAERMRAFASDVNGEQSYRRVIDAIAARIGPRRIAQVTTQARWEDVGWALTRPTWTRMISDFFLDESTRGPKSREG